MTDDKKVSINKQCTVHAHLLVPAEVQETRLLHPTAPGVMSPKYHYSACSKSPANVELMFMQIFNAMRA